MADKANIANNKYIQSYKLKYIILVYSISQSAISIILIPSY